MNAILRSLCLLLAVLCFALPAHGQDDGTPAIRGVYIRPPSLDILEWQMEQWRAMGARDVFLETFYHGLATNDSDVFNDRFGYDYLQEAIRLGQDHGLRVHAWIEVAYWSYGNTGQYLFDAHPEWAVVHIDGTLQGDIPGQTFANLAHPGVRDMMNAYVAELAAIPNLAGIQYDYIRYPTAPSGTAPYSYDAYSRQQFLAQYGSDPLYSAAEPGDPAWDDWVQWREDQVSEAVRQMSAAIRAVNDDILISAAVFASGGQSSSQLSKMQDWEVWTDRGDLDFVSPMAYGPSYTSIRNDINLSLNRAGSTQVVPALAMDGTAYHPPIEEQLNALKSTGLWTFALFEGNFFNDAQERQNLKDWLAANLPTGPRDVDQDEDVDAWDLRALFHLLGTSSGDLEYRSDADVNDDGRINAADYGLFFSVGP